MQSMQDSLLGSGWPSGLGEAAERGRFQLPSRGDAASLTIEVDSVTLAMMIGGVDLDTAKRRKRYQVAAG